MTNEEAIKFFEEQHKSPACFISLEEWRDFNDALDLAIEAIRKQEPMPVENSIERTWGIRKRVPVCPMCESFLTVMHFIGDGNGKKISYCDSCGQAVSWEEWKYDD